MRPATIAELSKELANRSPKQLLDYCLRLARHKNENKELLTYMLFESSDEAGYRKHIREQVSAQFEAMNRSTLYLTTKSVRKILRDLNRYIRYSGKQETEIELRMNFLQMLRDSGIPYRDSPVLVNLYQGQMKKIRQTIAKLHEDLQFDYQRELDTLES
jgi:hypothetical protein